MKLHRLLLAFAAVAVLVGVAYVAQATDTVASRMSTAAEKFLDTLSGDQKARAMFAFDDKERTNWYFVPREMDKKPIRKGVRLEEMSEAQRKAALEILRAGTSEAGYTKATTIMSLEDILLDLEKGRGPTRNSGWYFFTVYGTPSRTGKWGWRVEGHHLALSFTLDGGKVIGSTPALFGANPATVKSGPRAGLRTLPEAEDLARSLFKSLDDQQRKVALQEKPFPEIEQAKPKHSLGEPQGLAAAKMNEEQRGMLLKLLEGYASRLPAEIAAAEIKQVKEAGIEKVHFGYSGGTEPGQGYTYRIQGPTCLVEFLNMQNDGAGNPANHIHSCWRNIQGDFGLASAR